ncbi:hypothetical protein HERIO_2747 [Hepatospora eriocheir]|uniref:Uncharacterized protein n=1 Tax=Hepatospora eriocheir TaxID=1081669 RepID=A0A1X0QE90_9MICR|nr:hypothetical protein HERIO_2747 [Hepatospora eriocheir]
MIFLFLISISLLKIHNASFLITNLLKIFLKKFNNQFYCE